MKKYATLYYDTYNSSSSTADNTSFTPSSTFQSPGQVNINNLRDTFAAQIYGSSLNVFSGESVSDTFRTYLIYLSTATRSGIDLTARSTKVRYI